jgi:hypothetical protein
MSVLLTSLSCIIANGQYSSLFLVRQLVPDLKLRASPLSSLATRVRAWIRSCGIPACLHWGGYTHMSRVPASSH